MQSNQLAARLIYPLTLFSGTYLGFYIIYTLNLELFWAGVPIAVAAVVCFIGEKLWPYKLEWTKSHNDIKPDIAYAFFNLLTRELATPLLRIVTAGFLLSIPVLSNINSLWPSLWHPLLQLALAVVALDFFEYWFHRLSHRAPLLWRFHAIHHSAKRLYFFNSARFHIVDWFVLIIIETALLVVMGADAKIIALAALAIQIHGQFQHANIQQRNGWLNYIFSAAELHRWHHSKKVEQSDNNFGNNVIVWDLLFGTFYWPKGGNVCVIGLLNDQYPQSYLGQLLSPFRRKRLDQLS